MFSNPQILWGCEFLQLSINSFDFQGCDFLSGALGCTYDGSVCKEIDLTKQKNMNQEDLCSVFGYEVLNLVQCTKFLTKLNL